MSKKNKIVYLSSGEEAELLAQYQDGDETKYVIRVVIGEHRYEEGSELIYEDRIVSDIYEKYEDVPMFFTKTKLEAEIDELKENIEKLKEQETKLTKKLKSVYNPQFLIGTQVYYVNQFDNRVEELKIVRIVFTEQEDRSFYTYYLNKEYHSFEKIGNNYYLTKEEAEKALQEYLKNEEIRARKKIDEEYRMAKEYFKKVFGKEYFSDNN